LAIVCKDLHEALYSSNSGQLWKKVYRGTFGSHPIPIEIIHSRGWHELCILSTQQQNNHSPKTNLQAVLFKDAQYFFTKPKVRRILVDGLTSAGKSTLINRIQSLEERIPEITIATLGFDVRPLKYKGYSLVFWERSFEMTLSNCVDAIIMVVDSTNELSIQYAAREIENLIQNLDQNGGLVCLLCFANKQDLPTAVPTAELLYLLGLYSLKIPWKLQRCSTANGDGVFTGFDYLMGMLNEC